MFLPTRRSRRVPQTSQVALHLMDPMNRALDHRLLCGNADQRSIPFSIEILRVLVQIDVERKQYCVDFIFSGQNQGDKQVLSQ